MKALIAIALALTLAACQSMPSGFGGTSYDPGMTANQIKAIAGDRNAGVVCGVIPTHLGPAKFVAVNLDQKVIDNGGITADAEQCRVQVNNSKPAPVPATTASAKPPAN